jgi:hypothetical protein
MTDTRQAPPTPAQVERATALAAKLLAGRGLGKRLPVAAAAVGRALAMTALQTEHGQLLSQTLRPVPDGTVRPDDEVAVLNLGCHGTTPTAAAVANEVRDMAARHTRVDRLNAMAAPYAEKDGAGASAYVAAVLAETGQGPTWAELGDHMGWPRQRGTCGRRSSGISAKPGGSRPAGNRARCGQGRRPEGPHDRLLARRRHDPS